MGLIPSEMPNGMTQVEKEESIRKIRAAYQEARDDLTGKNDSGMGRRFFDWLLRRG